MQLILPKACFCEELIPEYFPTNDKLCDALWEAVKYKLNN